MLICQLKFIKKSPNLKMKYFVIPFLAACSLATKIEPELLKSLNNGQAANIFVSFEAGTSNVYKSLAGKHFTNRAEKVTEVNALLHSNAEASQEKVLSYLKANHAESFRSFWISNQIYVKNASKSLVDLLEKFPEVSRIVVEKSAHIDMPVKTTLTRKVDSNELTWGLLKIQAPDVWNLENGTRGEGVVIGGIDTGVRYTHEALAGNFLGEYGWYDPPYGTVRPDDDNGHGTHTVGTFAGSHGIGVAPGAKWMACRGCESDVCMYAALLACGEFMQCPTLADGSSPDCSKAPQIVSNSWGGPGGDTFFSDVINAWVASDIVPIFSNGNRFWWDPECGGAGSPADHPLAIGVGNTDEDDYLTYSSKKGPAQSGIIKPDLSAPGTEVLSAYKHHDTSYEILTGTSMASPHVAGIAALLLSRKPDLTVAQVREYLIYGNEQEGLLNPGLDCGGISENIFPNNAFGHGRISALSSYNKLNTDYPKH